MTENILNKLLSAKKYSDVCPDTLRRVAEEAAMRYKKPKDAEKAAKEALHGITGAFMDAGLIKQARQLLESGDINGALMLHSSTKERMPIADFYDELFSRTGRPGKVLDIACGLNPLYLGSIGIEVTGIDIGGAQIRLMNEWAGESGMPIKCLVGDALCEGFIPEGRWDIALIMKLLPVLENQKKGSAAKLIESVNADKTVVTFPTRTLGGRKVGMEQHYTEWFEGILPDHFRIIDRYICNFELVYIIE